MIEVGLKAPTWQFRDRGTGPVATFDLSLLGATPTIPIACSASSGSACAFLEAELRKLGADLRFSQQVTAVARTATR